MAKLPPPLEAQEAIVLASWMRMNDLDFCHVPNEAKRSYAASAALKAQGLMSGVPDYLVFTTPPNAQGVRGVAIELKRSHLSNRKGGGLSEAQIDWLKRLNSSQCDWLARVCYGAEEAISWLIELGYGPSTELI